MKMSVKRIQARNHHKINKIRARCKYICCLAALMRDQEDYFSTCVSRLSLFACKQVANGTLVGKPDSIEYQLKDAAANEVIQRKLFGKKITPFHKRELFKFPRKQVKRLLRD